MRALKTNEHKVLNYMLEYFEQYKNIPLTREISEATGLKRSTVQKLQGKLSELGYTDRFYVGKRMITMILWKP